VEKMLKLLYKGGGRGIIQQKRSYAGLFNHLLCAVMRKLALIIWNARDLNGKDKSKPGNIHYEIKTTYHIPCGG